MKNLFAAFSTDELMAEIARRNEARVHREPIPHCDECQNFVPAQGEVKDSYNPCGKGHVMKFRSLDALDGPGSDDWGHYRRGCADRILP